MIEILYNGKYYRNTSDLHNAADIVENMLFDDLKRNGITVRVVAKDVFGTAKKVDVTDTVLSMIA